MSLILDNNHIIIVIRAVLKEFSEHEHNSDEVLDLIKMCIPTDDDIPWLIKNSKDDLGRLKMLKFAKMDDGTEATI